MQDSYPLSWIECYPQALKESDKLFHTYGTTEAFAEAKKVAGPALPRGCPGRPGQGTTSRQERHGPLHPCILF